MIKYHRMMHGHGTERAAVRDSGSISGARRSVHLSGGERRRCDVALHDLRRTLPNCERHQFYAALVVSLASVAGVPMAFLGRLSADPVPALHALAFGGSDWATGDARSRPPMALPATLLGDSDAAPEEQRLRDWLLESHWLPPVAPGEVMLRLLHACDGRPIGVLGLDLGGPMAADDRHVRSTLDAFANLAERVLEQDATVASLQRDRSHLEAIIGSAMDAIVVADEQLRIVRFNDASERMFQRRCADVIGRPLHVLIPSGQADWHDRRVRDFSRCGATVRRSGALGEVRGVRADGSEFPAEVAISYVSSELGARYTAVVRDVTERKRLFEQLAAAESRFRSLVEQSLVGIFIVQGQRFRYLNPHMVAMLGCERADDLLDCIPLIELIAPAQRSRVTASIRECLAGPRRSMREQVRMLRRDGGVILVELHGQTFDLDSRPALIGVALDITERGRTEQALNDSEQLFRRMFDAMGEGVAVHHFVERDGKVCDYRVVDVNAAFERHTGIPALEARDRLASELYGSGAAPFLDRYAPLARGGAPLSFETHFEPLGRRFTISAFALDRQRFVTVFQDVTQQRRLEQEDRARTQELTRIGGLLTLGEMASTLAHELNQPLTSIANYSAGSLARMEAENATLTGLKDVLAVIGEEADRAGRILNGIRRFMERRDFKPVPIDVNDLVREVAGLTEIVERDRRISLTLELGSALPPVLADRVLIQVVLVNLFRNAIEALAEVNPSAAALQVRTFDAGSGQVETSVSDTGCGLPEQEADDVFRAFFTTKRNGVGLGLAIARSIVESHGGRIWATRNAGRGTTFHFTLKGVGVRSP
jgi:PAS domain S-box-containing protein